MYDEPRSDNKTIRTYVQTKFKSQVTKRLLSDRVQAPGQQSGQYIAEGWRDIIQEETGGKHNAIMLTIGTCIGQLEISRLRVELGEPARRVA